jgi:hypothetical protein
MSDLRDLLRDGRHRFAATGDCLVSSLTDTLARENNHKRPADGRAPHDTNSNKCH